jgi:hypothetical protein
MTTTKSWLGMIGVALLIGCVGCSGTTAPIAPSNSSIEIGSASGPRVAETSSEPTVTLRSDLTADPSTITVQAGTTLLVVNNSGRYVRMRSANCSDEFITMGLQDGAARHTMEFWPAGKTCDYFVWDTNWSRKIFNGRVYVP